jgi:hypothetical protein
MSNRHGRTEYDPLSGEDQYQDDSSRHNPASAISNRYGKTEYDPLSGEDQHQDKNKSKVSVDTALAVSDGIVVPIHGVLQSWNDQLSSAWYWILGTASFSAFASFYTYYTLVSKKQMPSYLTTSPTLTVSLVNIASHIVGFLVSRLIDSIFDVLHWSLASAFGGVSITTFLTTNTKTSPLDVAGQALTSGKHRKWGILRYSRLTYPSYA